MTDIPDGWYNDPEDVSQLRYWNGTEWTDHRSPRALAGAAAPDGGAWGIVGTTFRLIGDGWAQLLVLALPLVMLSIGAGVLAYLSLDAIVEPGLEEIFERFTEPGFDPVDDARDEAFVEAIEFSVGVGPIIGLVGAAIAFAAGTLITSTSFAVALARLRAGRHASVGETYRLLARRLPRIVGILLLWGLLGTVVTFAVGAVFVVSVLVSPVLLFAVIPAFVVAMIYLWPFGAIAFTALALSPKDSPPLRHVFAIVRPLWGPVAGRLLILTLVGMVVGFGLNIGTSVIARAGLVAAFVVPILLQALQGMLASAGSVVLYEFAGGRVDPAITAEDVR